MPQTNSIQACLHWAIQQLGEFDSASLDAKVLLCHVLDCQTVYLHTWPDKLLDHQQLNAFKHLVGKRAIGLPVAHLVGYREFWSLALKVSPATLIPRPETEILVEQALVLNLPTEARVLDLGTGTGAIALALASEKPRWQITAVDKQADAVALAKSNADELGLSQIEVLQSDWFSALQHRQFNLVVSNPPYVESDSPYLQQGDVRFEPKTALTSGQDGLNDIRYLITVSREHLVDAGWIMLEHGYQQAAKIRDLLEQTGYQSIFTLQDLNQLDRATLAQFCH